jgi:hypothetical protein
LLAQLTCQPTGSQDAVKRWRPSTKKIALW